MKFYDEGRVSVLGTKVWTRLILYSPVDSSQWSPPTRDVLHGMSIDSESVDVVLTGTSSV